MSLTPHLEQCRLVIDDGLTVTSKREKVVRKHAITILIGAAMALSVEHSTPDRRSRIRGSPGEIPPCTLTAPGVCKICRGCNVLQVTIQNYISGGTDEGEPSRSWRIKIVMAYLRTILRNESQTIDNRPLRWSSPALNPPTTYNFKISWRGFYPHFGSPMTYVRSRTFKNGTNYNRQQNYSSTCYNS